MKKILKYICIYFLTLLILFSLLILSSKIPRKLIYNNLKSSANYYRGVPGIKKYGLDKGYKELHYAADSKLLNIMYYIDSNHPIKTTMEARFYDNCPYDSNEDFIKVVDQDLNSNEQYIRYWHGSMAILRPLMLLLNIEQIYVLNNIIFWALFITLIVIIFKRYKLLAVVFFIASIMIRIGITPNCIEYIWTIFIMLVVSIISLLIEDKGNKKLYLLYFITGMVTCYLDFLTTETLTILVPVILTLLVRYKEKRIKNFKKDFKFIIISCALWFVSYAMMWVIKWILASIILKVNAFDYVKNNALLRMNMINDIQIPKSDYKTTILYNVRNISGLINIINFKVMYIFAILILLIAFLPIIKKMIIEKKLYIDKYAYLNLLLLMIGIIPYVRYLVMANHAYYHCFFTYRAQLPSIIATLFIIINSVDYIKSDFNKKQIIK